MFLVVALGVLAASVVLLVFAWYVALMVFVVLVVSVRFPLFAAAVVFVVVVLVVWCAGCICFVVRFCCVA